MVLPRASILGTLLKPSAGRVAARIRTQTLRQVGRRSYADAHGPVKKSSDLPWLFVSVVVTVPAATWLWQQGPKPGAHGHGHEGHDEHAEYPKGGGEGAKEEGEKSTDGDEAKDDKPEGDAKTKDDGDSKPEDESKDESKDDGSKSEDSAGDGEGAMDTPETSEDEGSDDAGHSKKA